VKRMTQMRWIVALQLLLCAIQAVHCVVYGIGVGGGGNVVALGLTLWAWRRLRQIEAEE
jgi:hypothetical protein